MDSEAINRLFLDRIKKLAIAYDSTYGEYPESPWEGLSFYEFAYEDIFGELPDTEPIINEYKGIYRNPF